MVGTQKDPKAKGMDDVDPKVKPPEKEEKGGGKTCCKKVLKFMFSHIGLCGMVIAYSVAGGFIFQHLEQLNEKMECTKSFEKYEPAENDTMHKMWKIAENFRSDDDMEYALKEFQKVLQSFRKVVLDLGYDGKNCSAYGLPDGPTHAWSLAGAMLFSVTVITTIGYGNIAPKTFWGRLVCIAYAILGIPLMLLCLANIGDVLADVFRFVYTKVCCCGCCRRKDKNRVESLKNDEANAASGGGGGQGAAGAGGGRRTPEAWKNQYAKQQQGMQDKGGPVVVDDDDDDEDDEDEKISVPLTITMAIIAVYILFGALLFGLWEEWSMLKASYFCFVTVSTIGFGDVVPGSASFEKDSDNAQIIGALVYMLFGMAILSMCFSLIQEEIVAKFRWVGEKLGIIEKEKDEGEDDENEDEEKSKQQQGTNNKGPAPAGPVNKGPAPMKGPQGMVPGMPPSKAGMPPGKGGPGGPPGGYPPMKPGGPGGPPPPMMPAPHKGPMPSVAPMQHRPPAPMQGPPRQNQPPYMK